jgi:hypothetical protein
MITSGLMLTLAGQKCVFQKEEQKTKTEAVVDRHFLTHQKCVCVLLPFAQLCWRSIALSS